MQRITQAGMLSAVYANTSRTLLQLATYQEQLSTGKKLNRISDDVVAARQSLRYRADERASAKWLDNIEKTLAFMGATDAALAEVVTVLDQAKALAVQGANGSQDAASRGALAQAVDSLLTRLIDIGNSVHDGRYLFGGTATTEDKPFALSADGSRVDYRGDLDAFRVEIGPNSAIEVNQNGHKLFKERVDLFAALIGLRDALRANDGAAVAASLTTIDGAHRHANDLLGSMGGRIQRLELARTQLEASQLYQRELVSQAEDIDFPEVVSKLQLTEIALQAGLQTAARTLTSTLLDFLR
ncbi:MAG: flagellar hook-associated protein FlgL [Planctomycetota bacterium]|nr:flagellar hook-associated protein FlgL [Planctomycetota bacterium]MDW8373197.1 flagellar hook-associated protein FlgL [Planctomycetota bacterium]